MHEVNWLCALRLMVVQYFVPLSHTCMHKMLGFKGTITNGLEAAVHLPDTEEVALLMYF